MKDVLIRTPGFTIALAESKAPARIQLMKTGTFDHPKYGKFQITSDDLVKFKENFDKKVRGVDLAVDYAHDSDKEAAAWLKSVELSDDKNELWAEVNWTPAGQKVVEDKEYRYISPDFHWDWENPETKQKCGPVLFGAALTNRPFLKNMQAVNFNESIPNGGNNMDEKDKKIAELEQQLAAMKQQMDASSMECSDLKKQLGDYQAKDQAAQKEKQLAEKKGKFDTMLSEGKVVEAQREAFMADDMVKFTELAQPVKLGEGGHGDPGKKSDHTTDAETKVIQLAEKKLEDKKAKNQGEAISMVLSENPELRKQYEAKFN